MFSHIYIYIYITYLHRSIPKRKKYPLPYQFSKDLELPYEREKICNSSFLTKASLVKRSITWFCSLGM